MATRVYNFTPRKFSLRKLEKDYGDFILSCRHKDILRCSITRHFTSCYRPDGICQDIPYKLCTLNYVAIIGLKDRSGAFIWRAFVTMMGNYQTSLIVHKIYGNPSQDIKDIIMEAFYRNNVNVGFADYDL